MYTVFKTAAERKAQIFGQTFSILSEECMVSIWQSTCSQDISREEVFHHGIRERNNWVWRLRKMASTPDLTPLDFFPRGYLKQQVYVTLPQALQDIKRRITDACANVSPSMLQRVQCEIQTRILMCIAADSAKFEHLK